MMTLVHFDEAVIHLMQYSVENSGCVILHFQRFDFHMVV